MSIGPNISSNSKRLYYMANQRIEDDRCSDGAPSGIDVNWQGFHSFFLRFRTDPAGLSWAAALQMTGVFH